MAKTKRHDWITLESRWIAGEWRTLKEMSQATGITNRMIQKRSYEHHWTEKRREVEAEATERARKRAIKTMADRLIEANERALKNAEVLLKLGLNKFIDKRGRLKVKSIGSEATALHAIKSAIQIEQAILRRLPLGGEAPGDGPIVPQDPLAVKASETGMEELTDAELDRLIADAKKELATDTGPAPAKDIPRTSGSRRKKKKKPRKK